MCEETEEKEEEAPRRDDKETHAVHKMAAARNGWGRARPVDKAKARRDRIEPSFLWTPLRRSCSRRSSASYQE